jgi:hypothetical protein
MGSLVQVGWRFLYVILRSSLIRKSVFNEREESKVDVSTADVNDYA